MRKSVYRKSELWEAYQKINIRDAISVIDQVGLRALSGKPSQTTALMAFLNAHLIKGFN